MGANGDLYCGRCGTRYLRPADPRHCPDCGREIGAGAPRDASRRSRRHLCHDCADRAGWE